MSLLELIFIFVLQFEAGISAEYIYIYKTPGQDVSLPCGTVSRSNSTCSIFSWIYYRYSSQAATEVYKRNVKQSSARAARLRLDSSCSLVVNNITAEDAGLYVCRQNNDLNQDVSVYLSVLTTSSSPPDADPKRDGEVTIRCSLSIYSYDNCQRSTIRWVNETGAVLPGQHVEYDLLGQIDCTSVLTVKRQSVHNRRYTCQFVKQGKVEIQANYTRGIRDDETKESDPDMTTDQSKQAYIIGAVVGGVILLAVIAAVLIKLRKKAAVTEDVQKPVTQHTDEADSNLTYVTVSHANQRTSPKKKEEEDVTYSTVKSSVKPEEETDLSTVYSFVNKPK